MHGNSDNGKGKLPPIAPVVDPEAFARNLARLVEEGSHAQLLARGGLYAKLVSLQFAGGAALEPSPSNGPGVFSDPAADALSIASSIAPRR